MTDAVFHVAAERSRSRLTTGAGLLLGAIASLGLWAGLAWAAVTLL